jgi:hypothetical protein
MVTFAFIAAVVGAGIVLFVAVHQLAAAVAAVRGCRRGRRAGANFTGEQLPEDWL